MVNLMIKKSTDLGLSFRFLRGFFKESIHRPLVELPLDPERFIRMYIIESSGGAIITNEIPTIVPDFSNPVYLVDIPQNFREIPIKFVVEYSKISFVYDTRALTKLGINIANGTAQDTKPLMGYKQNQESNVNSSFIIGIICGLLLQDEVSSNA